MREIATPTREKQRARWMALWWSLRVRACGYVASVRQYNAGSSGSLTNSSLRSRASDGLLRRRRPGPLAQWKSESFTRFRPRDRNSQGSLSIALSFLFAAPLLARLLLLLPRSHATLPQARALVGSISLAYTHAHAHAMGDNKITLDELTDKNLGQLKLINRTIFPVKYNDRFYEDLTKLPARPLTRLGMSPPPSPLHPRSFG